ncbi:hypothetical protein Y032_0067g45 [Ancylostoma ceylanicum]|uniref:Uncharacterized protein n=1 Tax=Ancylostoma ceylanicum TaxID=53326 RepID=A0A016U0Q2_9BILA|nr:hypothetical protein Y032_0067g45 [Ancylostoma ceylanicum]
MFITTKRTKLFSEPVGPDLFGRKLVARNTTERRNHGNEATIAGLVARNARKVIDDCMPCRLFYTMTHCNFN